MAAADVDLAGSVAQQARAHHRLDGQGKPDLYVLPALRWHLAQKADEGAQITMGHAGLVLAGHDQRRSAIGLDAVADHAAPVGIAVAGRPEQAVVRLDVRGISTGRCGPQLGQVADIAQVNFSLHAAPAQLGRREQRAAGQGGQANRADQAGFATSPTGPQTARPASCAAPCPGSPCARLGCRWHCGATRCAKPRRDAPHAGGGQPS